MQTKLTPAQQQSVAWDDMLDTLYILAAGVEQNLDAMPLPVRAQLASVREAQQRYISSLADAS